MITPTDRSTVDLTRTCVRLRNDLRFVPQQYGNETCYHMEVTSTGEYFRIGYTEYVFVSLLDGRTSFAQAMATTSQVLGSDAISQSDALVIYSWLLDHGISSFSETAESRNSDQRTRQTGSILSKLNPLYLKIPFGRPESLLKFIAPLTGWIFSGPAGVASLLLFAMAGTVLCRDWTRFTSASQSIFATDNWLWLMVSWVLLKVVHELGHALVCIRHGGRVGEMGLILACLAPLPYVDASSCWSFRSRWQRIHTAIAGVHIELICASAALLLWSRCESPELRQILQNVVVMASLSTIVFNMNPLMKFDGYYVLSDLLSIPNLYTEASQTLTRVCRRVLLGDSGPAPVAGGRHGWFLLFYGMASGFWRLMVCITLLTAASVLYHGAGVILALLGVTMWFAKPLWQMIASLNQFRRKSPARFLRGITVSSGITCAVLSLAFLLPAPVRISAPGIVEYTDGLTIRATTSGFVRRVHVRSGQQVHVGDILVELENDEIIADYFDLSEQIAQEELRLQTANRSHDSGAASVAQANLKSLQLQLAEKGRQRQGLKIIAESDGCAVGKNIESMLDTFVSEGDEILTIGAEDRKELRVSLHQTDLPAAMLRVNQKLPVRIGTHPRTEGQLVRVNPGATRKLPHPALAATNGGALTVTERPGDRSNDEKATLQLTEQRFDATIEFSPELSSEILCGERGLVTLGTPGCSAGVYCYRAGRRWLEEHLTALRNSQDSPVYQ
jgi:putative peptide zinc metalloprotease protein